MTEETTHIIFDGIILLCASVFFAVSTDQLAKLFTDPSLEGNPLVTTVNKAASKVNEINSEIEKLQSNQQTADSQEKTADLIAESEQKKQTVIEDTFNKGEIGKNKDTLLTSRDLHECTALMMVCYINYFDHAKTLREDKNKLPFIKEMIKEHADINAKDKNGWTALSWAAWSGVPEICKLLLSEGADLNVKDDQDNTLLMMAAMRGNTEVIDLLLSKGVDIEPKCKNGLTALEYAKREYERVSAPSLIAELNYMGLKIIDRDVRAQNIKRFQKTVEILEAATK